MLSFLFLINDLKVPKVLNDPKDPKVLKAPKKPNFSKDSARRAIMQVYLTKVFLRTVSLLFLRLQPLHGLFNVDNNENMFSFFLLMYR